MKAGLRFEIVVSLSLMVVAAAGLMGLVVFKLAQQEMIDLKLETGLVLAKAIEAGYEPARSDERLAEVLETMAATDFQRLVVVDRGGRVVAQVGPPPFTLPPSRGALMLAMDTRQAQTEVQGAAFPVFAPGLSLTMAVPLFKDRIVVGAVGLYSPLAEMAVTWTRVGWTIGTFLLLDTLVMVLFGAYLLSRRVVGPLEKMVERVVDLTAGRYVPGQVRPETPREIGRLEDSFEQMASRLMASQAHLEANLASLRQTQEGLVQSEKMASVGRLAAGLAHELGNPLGSLLGFVHILGRDDTTPEERSDFLRRMATELTRMDSIIRSLLDFARQSPVRPGPVDLVLVVRDALALATVQKWFAGLTVHTDLPTVPPARGQADRLIQVLLNLLSNAGQAMNGQGELNVAIGSVGEDIFMAVADTGPGIDPGVLPHVCEPFFTTKEPGQGTGLGLAVSLAIVESLGGRMEIASQTGEGSIFQVILPRWSEAS